MAWINLSNLTRFFKQLLVKDITWKGKHTFSTNTSFTGGLTSSGGSTLEGGTNIKGTFNIIDGVTVSARPSPNMQPIKIFTAGLDGLKYKNSEVATKAELQNITVTIDSELSDTSENPVQNKVIKAELDNKITSTTDDMTFGWSGQSIVLSTLDNEYSVTMNPKQLVYKYKGVTYQYILAAATISGVPYRVVDGDNGIQGTLASKAYVDEQVQSSGVTLQRVYPVGSYYFSTKKNDTSSCPNDGTMTWEYDGYDASGGAPYYYKRTK